MTENTELPTFDVSDDVWSSEFRSCVKVVISGIGASDLPNHVLKNCLLVNEVLRKRDDKLNSIDIVLLENRRKRFVYAPWIFFSHRMRVNLEYEGQKLSLLLLNTNTKYL